MYPFAQSSIPEADSRFLYGPGDRRLVTFDTTTRERIYKLRGPMPAKSPG